MKYFALLLSVLGVIIFSSCHNYKKDAEQLQMQRDSIQREAALKDSSIVVYLTDFSEIIATLDSIKRVEELVTVNSANRREMTYLQRQRILEDIDLLHKLIQKNKTQITDLQTKLNNSNYKISKLNEVVKELENFIDNLEKQLLEKDTEIAQLTSDVKELNSDVIQLNEKIAVVESISAEKSDTIALQTRELNKSFFVVGSVKELKENGIVDRVGGFLGIGRNTIIGEDFNPQLFTEINRKDLDLIPLNAKKAEIITPHPIGTYHVSGTTTSDTLFIDDKLKFWSLSKFLVVGVKY